MDAEPLESSGTGPFAKVGECLYRHQSSGVYYALVKRGGKQHRRSLRTTDRALANRRLPQFRADISRLDPKTGAAHLNFREFAEERRGPLLAHLKPASARRREVCLRQLNDFFGNLAIRKLTRADCERWAAHRGPEVAPATFNHERDTLRLILGTAQDEGLILDNPAQSLARRRVGKRQILIPSHEEFSALMRSLRSMDPRAHQGADLVELLAYSGMRLREGTELRWGDVDCKRGVFVVTGGERGTKNHDVRTVPLFPAMRQLLERLHREGEDPEERLIGINDAKRAIETACRKAGLSHYSHHTFRHYFVSNAIEAGIDFKVIAGWVGHKDGGILVAKTYGHLRDAHSFEMAKRMVFSVERMPGLATS